MEKQSDCKIAFQSNEYILKEGLSRDISTLGFRRYFFVIDTDDSREPYQTVSTVYFILGQILRRVLWIQGRILADIEDITWPFGDTKFNSLRVLKNISLVRCAHL